MPTPRAGRHAIVIGGSLAGLIATRVLSDHVEQVTLIERDQFSAAIVPRKGVPQGRHTHGLLAAGQDALERLFPGLVAELINTGALAGDVTADMRWYQHGDYKAKFTSGLRGLLLSRPLLESVVRGRVLALPNVVCRDGHAVNGLDYDMRRGSITGVRVSGAAGDETVLHADLVVDASGRGSRSPAWLEALGYPRPPEDVIEVGVGYTSRLYRRRPDDLGGDRGIVVLPRPPHETRTGVMVAVEGDRWLVTLGGWLGDHAPTDPDGFLAFARSLPAPDIYDVINTAEPLSQAVVHRFPSNRRRRYEQLQQFPAGYLVLGDALCSFNPVYGQGMTVAALQGLALQASLGERPDGAGLARRFFRRAATVIDTPWSLVLRNDFTYPAVRGHRPPGTRVLNWYIAQLHQAAHRDAVVCRAFLEVTNLLAPPRSLFHPRIAVRVLAARSVNRYVATAGVVERRSTTRSAETTSSAQRATGTRPTTTICVSHHNSAGSSSTNVGDSGSA